MSHEEPDDRVLFGPETDDEDEDNKLDHEVEDVKDEEEDDHFSVKSRKRPRAELSKNKLLKKMIEQAKKQGDIRRIAEKNAQESWCMGTFEEEDTLTANAGRKRKKTVVRTTEVCTDPILVKENDLEERKSRAKRTRKIGRELDVKQTRYFPFFKESTKNPRKFYTETTDLCCMWCTLQINGVPYPMPYNFSVSMNVFYVGGQYCSYQCLLADSRKQKRSPITCHMIKTVYKVPFSVIQTIKPAPSPYLLKKFGGVMEADEYRATLNMYESISHREIRLPFIPISAGIEEVEKMKTTIYEYGDDEKVERVVNATLMPHKTFHMTQHRKVQKSRYSSMPTLEEQIKASEAKLVLEKHRDEGKSKRKTLKDFMKIKQ